MYHSLTMVRVWAEKEMRNLKRLKTAGICCPEPIEVRENVLVMTFVGDKDGWASPRLKDADIPESAFPDLYVELLLMTRKMFIDCKLVHADLSEYNILYHIDDTEAPPADADGHTSVEPSTSGAALEETEAQPAPRGHLWIIDVSQSVEHDHPHAFDFLRADLHNVEDFFSKRGAPTIGLRRTFEFVTRDNIASDGTASAEEVLRAWMAAPEPDSSEPHPDGERNGGAAHEDEVFMRSYIPRTLNEVYDPERDVDVLARGDGGNLIYRDTIGIVAPAEKGAGDLVDGAASGAPAGKAAQPKKAASFAADGKEGPESSDEDEGPEGPSGDEEDGSEDEDGAKKDRKPRGHRHEDKEAKKERKKASKEEAREKRKHKIPKAEKKRKVKATARGG